MPELFFWEMTMMKFNFPLLEKSLMIQPATFFCVDDVTVFASLVKEFYQYTEESRLKLFDEKQSVVKSSELMIITDIFGYGINSPSTLKLIYADLESQLNQKPEVKSMIDKLASTISDLIGYELLEHELDLEEDEITVLELFKALGIQIETSSDTLFEKIIEIIQVYKYLSKKKLLVFINVCAYLTKEELLEIKNYIALSQEHVLFLEPRELPGFTTYYLDEDYFLHQECIV